jgi:hypothetical protein
VPRRKQLKLVFALHMNSSNVVRMHHVSAVVTRSESNGVGMMFCENKHGRSARHERNSSA